MKIVNVVVFLILSSFLITSCQKELDFGTFESTGTLKTDSAFDCLPSSVHGTYVVDAALTDTNYIEIQVNTTLSGNYLIQSDSTNGYSFKGTGSFSGVGSNTVRLYGVGTPRIPGTNSFIIHYNTPGGDSSFCIIDIDVIANAGANAEYTFAGAGGTCTGGGYAGIYAANVPMNASNTDTVTVTVTVLGNYSISTAAINGVTFLASGAFTTLGIQTVVLTANGTPLVQGPFDFPVSGNSPGCAFSITFDPPPPPAVFTLGGTPGVCTGVTLGGGYQVTIPVTAANTATIDVNVTTAGLYTISTNTVNGITFITTGVFTTTGPQSVVLNASGTPTAPGPVDFTVTGGSSTCAFNVNFDPAPTGIFHCKIDGVYTDFGNNASGTYLVPFDLTMSGDNVSPVTFVLDIDRTSTSTAITPGTYTLSLTAGYLVSASYTDPSNAFWSPLSFSITPDPFTIVISAISATQVTGTFSGTIREGGTGSVTKQISEGVFDIPIQ